MPSMVKYSAPSAAIVLLTTQLDGLTNGARALSAALLDNREQYGDVELVAAFGTAPAADSPIYLYLIEAPDGTNYEDGSATVTPSALPDVVITVRAVTTAQRVSRQRIALPNGDYKVLLINSAGQALAATGNTLTLWTYNDELQ